MSYVYLGYLIWLGVLLEEDWRTGDGVEQLRTLRTFPKEFARGSDL